MSTLHTAESPQPTLAGLIRSHAETIAHLREENITDTSFATYLAGQPGCRWTALQIVREIQRQRARARSRTISPEEKSMIESVISQTHATTNGHRNCAAAPAGDRAAATSTTAAPPRRSLVPASERESHLD